MTAEVDRIGPPTEMVHGTVVDPAQLWVQTKIISNGGGTSVTRDDRDKLKPKTPAVPDPKAEPLEGTPVPDPKQAAQDRAARLRQNMDGIDRVPADLADVVRLKDWETLDHPSLPVYFEKEGIAERWRRSEGNRAVLVLALRAAGLTQGKVSDLLHISQQRVSQIEGGKSGHEGKPRGKPRPDQHKPASNDHEAASGIPEPATSGGHTQGPSAPAPAAADSDLDPGRGPDGNTPVIEVPDVQPPTRPNLANHRAAAEDAWWLARELHGGRPRPESQKQADQVMRHVTAEELDRRLATVAVPLLDALRHG